MVLLREPHRGILLASLALRTPAETRVLLPVTLSHLLEPFLSRGRSRLLSTKARSSMSRPQENCTFVLCGTPGSLRK